MESRQLSLQISLQIENLHEQAKEKAAKKVTADDLLEKAVSSFFKSDIMKAMNGNEYSTDLESSSDPSDPFETLYNNLTENSSELTAAQLLYKKIYLDIKTIHALWIDLLSNIQAVTPLELAKIELKFPDITERLSTLAEQKLIEEDFIFTYYQTAFKQANLPNVLKVLNNIIDIQKNIFIILQDTNQAFAADDLIDLIQRSTPKNTLLLSRFPDVSFLNISEKMDQLCNAPFTQHLQYMLVTYAVVIGSIIQASHQESNPQPTSSKKLTEEIEKAKLKYIKCELEKHRDKNPIFEITLNKINTISQNNINEPPENLSLTQQLCFLCDENLKEMLSEDNTETLQKIAQPIINQIDSFISDKNSSSENLNQCINSAKSFYHFKDAYFTLKNNLSLLNTHNKYAYLKNMADLVLKKIEDNNKITTDKQADLQNNLDLLKSTNELFMKCSMSTNKLSSKGNNSPLLFSILLTQIIPQDATEITLDQLKKYNTSVDEIEEIEEIAYKIFNEETIALSKSIDVSIPESINNLILAIKNAPSNETTIPLDKKEIEIMIEYFKLISKVERTKSTSLKNLGKTLLEHSSLNSQTGDTAILIIKISNDFDKLSNLYNETLELIQSYSKDEIDDNYAKMASTQLHKALLLNEKRINLEENMFFLNQLKKDLPLLISTKEKIASLLEKIKNVNGYLKKRAGKTNSTHPADDYYKRRESWKNILKAFTDELQSDRTNKSKRRLPHLIESIQIEMSAFKKPTSFFIFNSSNKYHGHLLTIQTELENLQKINPEYDIQCFFDNDRIERQHLLAYLRIYDKMDEIKTASLSNLKTLENEYQTLINELHKQYPGDKDTFPTTQELEKNIERKITRPKTFAME